MKVLSLAIRKQINFYHTLKEGVYIITTTRKELIHTYKCLHTYKHVASFSHHHSHIPCTLDSRWCNKNKEKKTYEYKRIDILLFENKEDERARVRVSGSIHINLL